MPTINNYPNLTEEEQNKAFEELAKKEGKVKNHGCSNIITHDFNGECSPGPKFNIPTSEHVVKSLIHSIRKWPSSKNFWIEKTMFRINLQDPDWIKRNFAQ